MGLGAVKQDGRLRIYGILGVISVGMTLLVCYVLTLVGCISVSPSVPEIFLVRLHNTKTLAEVRVGYFGMCAMLGNTMTCTPSFAAGGNSTTPSLLTSTDASLNQLLALGHDIQQKIIVFVPLVIGGILYFAAVLSLFYYVLFARQRPGPTLDRTWAATVYLTTYSVAGAVGAASAVSMASSALRFAGTNLGLGGGSPGGGVVVASGGTSLQVLQWMIVGLTVMWHICIPRLWSPPGGTY